MKSIGEDNNSDNDGSSQSCSPDIPGLPKQASSTSVEQFDGSADTW